MGADPETKRQRVVCIDWRSIGTGKIADVEHGGLQSGGEQFALWHGQ